MILSELPPLGPPVFHRSINLDGAWRGSGGGGELKHFQGPRYEEVALFVRCNHGDINSFIYAISFFLFNRF